MVNTHKKGLRIENKAKKILETEGWLVEQTRWSRWSQKDFFGLFDLIAINSRGQRKFVQVKTEKVSKKIRNQIGEFAKNYGNIFESFEIWVYVMRRNFKFTIYRGAKNAGE